MPFFLFAFHRRTFLTGQFGVVVGQIHRVLIITGQFCLIVGKIHRVLILLRVNFA